VIEPVYTASLRSRPPLKLSSWYHITIVDLKPLLSTLLSHPTIISEFTVPKRQPSSNLEFTKDGMVIHVLQRRRVPSVLKSDLGVQVAGSTEDNGLAAAAPWHMYNLAKSALPEHSLVLLSFIFVLPFDAALPTNFLSPSTSAPPSVHSSPVKHPAPLSPHHARRPSNYQDVLVFDPAGGSFPPRPFTTKMRPRDQVTPFLGSVSNLGVPSSPYLASAHLTIVLLYHRLTVVADLRAYCRRSTPLSSLLGGAASWLRGVLGEAGTGEIQISLRVFSHPQIPLSSSSC
jgi:hypothetical protein